MKKFDKSFTLSSTERLNKVEKHLDFKSGVTLLAASVGVGKTTYFVNKPNVYITAPLISIKQSEIDKGATNIFTWQAMVAKVKADPMKYALCTLVVDESHGLYMDFNYKPGAIRELIEIFKYFKSVVVMSGTIDPNFITSFPIDRSYSIYKPQQATKLIDTYVYTKNGLAALEAFIQARRGKRKTLVLLNEKELCDQLASRYGERALVVNADEKANEDVLELYASRLMGNKWDIIFGTNSIREGLSIEDKVDEVDVIIYGHTDPDVIEQFSNRFREVSDLKHVHYFIPNSPVKEIADFDVVTFTRETIAFCETLNTFYNNDSHDDSFRDYLRTTFHDEAKGSYIRFNKESGCFVVDLVAIDAKYYNARKLQVQSDPVLFESKMMALDFCTNPVLYIEGDQVMAEIIKEGKKVSKERRAVERIERIKSITESFCTNEFTYAGDDEYDYVVESITKLLKKGLKREQIPLVVDSVIKDKDFINKIWSDYHYVDIDGGVRNQLLYYIAAECPNDELTPVDTYIMSNMVLTQTLREFFQGDEKLMRANREWSRMIEWKGGRLQVKTNCEVRVINKHITLGERIQKRVTEDSSEMIKSLMQIRKTDRYNVYPVKFTNLTGFVIDVPEVTETEKEKAQQSILSLKERFIALRA
ncbi:hypothetical protein BvCmsK145A_03467 [Escherichia coli]|uniref:hypothetical protein n=1 Tax=Escherichia coli TaxID=562 RepID=UPI0010B83575|nr:hypothetical protein [Escherichia coli]GCI49417.1 hypothetical protein BvCmsK145A_03467 [Escherichia coli]